MTETTTAQATVTGALAQAAGDWDLDVAHSTLEFVARYLVVSKVRGTFRNFSGTATIGPDPEHSGLEVTIDASSIDTRNEQRDAHLRGPEFFDVERYPAIHYRSTRLEPAGENGFRAAGDLTMHGVTAPLTLEGEFLGIHRDPFGREKAVVNAETTIDRERWGLTWNQALETGGVLVGKDIKLEIEAQFLRKQG